MSGRACWVVFAALLFSASVRADPTLPPDAGADLDSRWAAAIAAFDASLPAAGAPGAALAVVVDGKLRFTHAVGVTELGKSTLVQPTTLFQWASVTKVLTSIATLRLVQRHRLALAAPVSRYLPEMRVDLVPDSSPITVDELLHHTSGLGSSPMPTDPALDSALPDYLTRFLSIHEMPQLSPAGRLFNYSNLGFALLGLIDERVAKHPYEQVIHDEVLVPAGMTTATLEPAEAQAVDHAVGYSFGSSGVSRIEPDTIWGARYRRPFGGLQASVIDVAHLAEALLDADRLEQGGLEEMGAAQTPTGELADRSYGRGLFVEKHRGARLVYHHGEQGGFSSMLLLLPERRFALILVASVSGYPARSTAIQLADGLLDLPGPDPDPAAGATPWRQYRGTFFDPMLLQHFRVYLDGGKLMLGLTDAGHAVELTPAGGDSFTFTLPRKLGGAQRTGTFFLDAKGKAEFFALTNAVGARE